MSRNPWKETPCCSQVWPVATPVPFLPPPSDSQAKHLTQTLLSLLALPHLSFPWVHLGQQHISGLNTRISGNLKEVLCAGAFKGLCWLRVGARGGTGTAL